MKALKSALAKRVLADPSATLQLRAYLASKNSQPSLSTTVATDDVISLHSAQEGTVLYRLTVVPKAA
ncbi:MULTISPECIES: hypothetical protein [Collimonas]|jgi:hypothetical protein|uniref:Uncharacterized protein n=1 Tax=Collimonas pratensis TaxID=279113 RepID=A0A127Q419_9BURK|nr:MULTISPECIES: hypothetical protein [Collimonas]AMP04392.1 hypothetical protein CPter91_2022 [Collimonas pratensis]AMP15614.1 hypothetical protein CPter291_3379 [Collimonas pratensis]NKI69953.1 hypothetical protein [Collimonas pratensis]HWX00265.1 hypothetical protein [Collimonas sp.]